MRLVLVLNFSCIVAALNKRFVPHDSLSTDLGDATGSSVHHAFNFSVRQVHRVCLSRGGAHVPVIQRVLCVVKSAWEKSRVGGLEAVSSYAKPPKVNRTSHYHRPPR